jgi:hypothetical protein
MKLTIKPSDRMTIVKMLQNRQGGATLRSFAEVSGIPLARLSDIYNGKAEPDQRVLDYLNLKIVITRK